MGAWGIGTFDNDDAADLLLDYEDGGVAVIVDVFSAVRSGSDAGYLEADIGSMGLAAAEIVATSNDKPQAGMDEDIRNSIRVHEADIQALKGGAEAALVTVQMVSANENKSELYELWLEADNLNAWLAVVDDLKTRLEEVRG